MAGLHETDCKKGVNSDITANRWQSTYFSESSYHKGQSNVVVNHIKTVVTFNCRLLYHLTGCYTVNPSSQKEYCYNAK